MKNHRVLPLPPPRTPPSTYSIWARTSILVPIWWYWIEIKWTDWTWPMWSRWTVRWPSTGNGTFWTWCPRLPFPLAKCAPSSSTAMSWSLPHSRMESVSFVERRARASEFTMLQFESSERVIKKRVQNIRENMQNHWAFWRDSSRVDLSRTQGLTPPQFLWDTHSLSYRIIWSKQRLTTQKCASAKVLCQEFRFRWMVGCTTIDVSQNTLFDTQESTRKHFSEHWWTMRPGGEQVNSLSAKQKNCNDGFKINGR